MIAKVQTSRLAAWATIGAYLCLFLLGFTDNLKGPTLPALLGDLRLNYAQGAGILLGAQIGFTLATLAAGVLNDLIGSRRVVLLTGTCLLIGAAGYSLFRPAGLLMLAMLLMGVGLGSLNVSGNSLIIAFHNDQKGRYLNQMSFFHGLASMAAPFYAGQALAAGFSWRLVYQLALIPIAGLLLYFLFLRLPHAAPVQPTRPADWRGLGRSAFTPAMLLFYLIGILYVSAEMGTSAWLVEFLQRVKGQSVPLSAAFLSFFWGVVMVGRLAGSLLVERIGYIRLIGLMALGVSLCMGIGTFGPPQLAFFLPLSGLFYAIIFPTTTAAISSHHPEKVNTIIGLFLTAGGLGGVIGSGSVGFISNQVGIQFGFGITTLFGVLMAITAFVLIRITQENRGA